MGIERLILNSPGEMERRPETVGPTPEEFRLSLEQSEGKAWREVLGAEIIEITPPPDFVTPRVAKELRNLGFELCYIPGLNIGTVNDLKEKGVKDYLASLEIPYPRWKRYESLSEERKTNPLVCRNMNEWYWGQVAMEKIKFPNKRGFWMAVETMPKPPYGGIYETPKAFADILMRYPNRFNVSFNEVSATILRAEGKILSRAGLPILTIRMLEALEWNLLANRYGWGGTDTQEILNTKWKITGEPPLCLVAGSSVFGGASFFYWINPNHAFDYVGFRLAIILGS